MMTSAQWQGDPIAAVAVSVTGARSCHAPRLRYEIYKLTNDEPVMVFARDVAGAEFVNGQFVCRATH